jgi:hypothetical protein
MKHVFDKTRVIFDPFVNALPTETISVIQVLHSQTIPLSVKVEFIFNNCEFTPIEKTSLSLRLLGVLGLLIPESSFDVNPWSGVLNAINEAKINIQSHVSKNASYVFEIVILMNYIMNVIVISPQKAYEDIINTIEVFLESFLQNA